MYGVIFDYFGYGTAPDFFEFLGELTCHRNPAVAQDFLQLGERAEEPMGGFIQNDGAFLLLELFKQSPPTLLEREKPLVHETVGSESARDDRRKERRWTGHRNDRDNLINGCADDPDRGIRYPRCSGVRNNGNGFSRFEVSDQS